MPLDGDDAPTVKFGFPPCLLLLALLCGCATNGPPPGLPSTSSGTPPGIGTYRGFTIDDSRVRKLPTLAAVRAATQEQIDMVCAVGVTPDVLAFFQRVPFRLVPAGTIPSGTPGFYGGRRDQSVDVVASIVSVGHKPVLLHELLHAYHDQLIPGGFGNGEIRRFYQRARNLSSFAPQSHMMSNEKEFFACAATTYLFGVTAQEPFQRANLRASQPEFYAYLEALFGPGAGSFPGSLTR